MINLGLEPDLLNHLSVLEKLRLKMKLGGLDNMFNDIAEERFSKVLPQTLTYGFTIDPEFRARLADAPSESLEAAALAYVHITQLTKARS